MHLEHGALPPALRVALDANDADDPALVATFAATIVRRSDRDVLEHASADALAAWITDRARALSSHQRGEVSVRVGCRPQALDGTTPAPLSVDVICDDRPFLLSTVNEVLRSYVPRTPRLLHAVIGASFDDDGRFVTLTSARQAEHRLFVLHAELHGVADDNAAALREELLAALGDVVRATEDFAQMRTCLIESANELRFGAWTAPDADEDDPSAPGEVADFLDWLFDGNFVLLGVRDYAIDTDTEPHTVRVVEGSGLGLLADETSSRYASAVPIAALPAAVQRQRQDAPLLTMTRTTRDSTVQRRERMQYFGLTRRGDDGNVVGERRILGLLTRKALSEPVRSTPVLRAKLQQILTREDVIDGSYDEIQLTSLFQALPKDEAFQASVDELHTMLVELQHAAEASHVRVFTRTDPHVRLVSVVVSVPRDRYSAGLRQRIQAHLHTTFGAERVTVEVSLGDRPDALARFLLHLSDTPPDVDPVTLEQQIRAIARSWIDDLLQRLGEEESSDPRAALALRLPTTYREVTSIDTAIADLALLQRLDDENTDMVVEIRTDHGPTTPRIRVAKKGDGVSLSAFLPMLESLGLAVIDEVPHRLGEDGDVRFLHDFGAQSPPIDAQTDGARIAAAITACWHGHLTVDSLNGVVLRAGVDWHAAHLLRAYRRLRRQLGTTFTSEYVNRTLVNHPEVVRTLVTYFRARFHPDATDEDAATARAQVVEACDQLERLDDDRILRGFLELMDATVRTNAFREDARADETGEPYVSFKIDPSRIFGVAAPVPYREIFVHSPRVEGVHLRYGPVARGGLRWSDRRDDVRDEVFDLVRAQVLKNALIVPSGAKGGFTITHEPHDPARLRAEVQRQYVTFVRGMLDVTDNIVEDDVVAPPHVRAHDDADPYLVVAADRGTATFSDTANALAARYGFWLDDAFASGGSNGYDHKKLGVTARGAWLAVRRHFRELGIDTQTEAVRVVGVGDMSGDVFGNGMLQSHTIELVAAFDHRDIFIDPHPDAGRSYAERARLFALPGSSWQDYNREAMSDGGGVYSRSARTVTVSQAAADVLRLPSTTLTPPELIRAILCAPVDLLFAGGIGTYVKSSQERNADVADRANDELRVDAANIRARVIGEGANLFVTPLGRLEYARRGGHVNQDAVDNAAGVATSDIEVNLKILLNAACDQGLLERSARDDVLAALSDDAVDMVMRAVDQQAAAVTRETARSPELMDAYGRLLAALGSSHDLDPAREQLPDPDELAARMEVGAGLLRPEVASLLAWSKRVLKEALLATTTIDLALFRPVLAEPFPVAARDQFGAALDAHRLKRELIATSLTNELVDRMGVTFVFELAERNAVALDTVVVAYRLAREAIDAPHLWSIIDRLALTHDAERIREMETTVEQTIATITGGLVGHDRLVTEPAELAADLSAMSATLRSALRTLGTSTHKQARAAHLRWLIDDLIDPTLAEFLAVARELAYLPDVADVARALAPNQNVEAVMDAFLHAGERFGIDDLEERLSRVRPHGLWASRQRDGIAADLRHARRDAALHALAAGEGRTPQQAVAAFAKTRAVALTRAQNIIGAAHSAEGAPLDAVAVAVRAVLGAITPAAKAPS